MLMIQKMHALQSLQAAGGGFPVNAVDFDGTNDYLSRGSDLTGAFDSPLGVLSFWCRLDGGDGSLQDLLVNDIIGIRVRRSSANQIEIRLENSGTAIIFRTAGTVTASASWFHILASWNTNFSSGNKVTHIYVNDASDKVVQSDASGPFDVDYTSVNWFVGAHGVNRKLNGCLSEVYLASGQFLDFSVDANRRKFISATGKPVNLGADGSLPTGTAPIIYLNNPAATFNVNKGTGGNFTITGTLDPASTSPSS